MQVKKVSHQDQLKRMQLKILVAKLSNGVYVMPGGMWSKSMDRGDPCIDDRAVIETSIRWVRQQCGIDLGLCSGWAKVSQFNYRTHDNHGLLEIRTVVLLPCVSDLIPSKDMWDSIRKSIMAEAGALDEKNPNVKKWIDQKSSWFLALNKQKIGRLDTQKLREELKMRGLSTIGDTSTLKLRLYRATKSTNNFKVFLPKEPSIIVGHPHGEIKDAYLGTSIESRDTKACGQWSGYEFLTLREISSQCKNSFFSSLNNTKSDDMLRVSFETYVIGMQMRELMQRYHGRQLLEMLRSCHKKVLNRSSVKATGYGHAKEEVVPLSHFIINDRWLRALQFFDMEGKGYTKKASLEHILTITCRSEKLSVGEIRCMLDLCRTARMEISLTWLYYLINLAKKRTTTDN